MTNLTTATLLRYLPRGATYTILNHNLLIKVGDSWEEGCLYQNVDSSSKLFVRPYKAFNMDKWEILEQGSSFPQE